jgi:TRAP transporter TAXI family solute receptor
MKLSVLTAAVGIALGSTMAIAEPVNLTLSGGNPGGLWSLLGAGIDRATKVDDASSVVTYQATGGGFANIGLLGANRTDLGLMHDAEAKIALQGDEPFKAPINNLRAIGYLYNWAPMHFFLERSAAERYGIDSLDDIAGSGAPLRIGINRSGNITSNVALMMLEEAGVTEETLENAGGQFVRAGANEQADLIQDGRLDLITNGIFVNHSSFRAVDQNSDVVLLTVPAEIIEATNAAFGTRTMTIPGGSYSNQTADVASVALGAILVATDAMPDEVATSLASSLVNNIDEVRAVHSSMKELTPQLLATPSVLEFHPAAAEVYRKAGLIN